MKTRQTTTNEITTSADETEVKQTFLKNVDWNSAVEETI